jgi:PAS domain S-box-containing protein
MKLMLVHFFIVSNIFIATCYFIIAFLIVRQLLQRQRQLLSNPLVLATAAIFLAGGLEHSARVVLTTTCLGSRHIHTQGLGIQLGFNLLTAIAVGVYIALRRNYPLLIDGPLLLAQTRSKLAQAHTQMAQMNANLEALIAERTAELLQTNETLATQIRDRNFAKAKLRATTSRLLALIENLQAGILVEDEERQIVLVNQEFCNLFGINSAPSSLIGLDCSQSAQQAKGLFAHPQRFVEGIKSLLENQQVVTNEELLLVDGRIFERDYIPIFVAGEYRGHLWHYRDVTSRKQAEATLRESEARFRAMADSAPVMIWMSGLDQLCNYFNRGRTW